MSVYNFLVSGPKFTQFFSPNRGWNAVDQVLFRFSTSRCIPETFAIKVESCQPLRYIWRWISQKPWEIEAWFQRTTNRKWPMGYQMVTWSMTSRDPQRCCEAVGSAILATAWHLVRFVTEMWCVTPLLQQSNWLELRIDLSARCTRLPVSSWFGATVSRQRSPACLRPRHMVASTLRVYLRSRRSDDASVHRRRPCLSSCCYTYVEQSTRLCHVVTVSAHVQTSSQDCTYRSE